jgi:methylase of polypeptide subunit release factors
MDYIRKFFIQVKEFLKPNGKIFLEFDPFQKKKIKEILEKEKFKFIFKKDQFGKFRWLKAQK